MGRPTAVPNGAGPSGPRARSCPTVGRRGSRRAMQRLGGRRSPIRVAARRRCPGARSRSPATTGRRRHPPLASVQAPGSAGRHRRPVAHARTRGRARRRPRPVPHVEADGPAERRRFPVAHARAGPAVVQRRCSPAGRNPPCPPRHRVTGVDAVRPQIPTPPGLIDRAEPPPRAGAPGWGRRDASRPRPGAPYCRCPDASPARARVGLFDVRRGSGSRKAGAPVRGRRGSTSACACARACPARYGLGALAGRPRRACRCEIGDHWSHARPNRARADLVRLDRSRRRRDVARRRCGFRARWTSVAPGLGPRPSCTACPYPVCPYPGLSAFALSACGLRLLGWEPCSSRHSPPTLPVAPRSLRGRRRGRVRGGQASGGQRSAGRRRELAGLEAARCRASRQRREPVMCSPGEELVQRVDA